MRSEADYLLVGGGLAAARCAAVLAAQGAGERVLMIGAESYPPYNRPPLSKGLLLGYDQPERIGVFGLDYYERHGIELWLDCVVDAVDSRKKLAATSDGRRVKYDKLLAATGSAPRKLHIPGAALENIFYLRTLDDYKALKTAIKKSKRALIVGGGFIGMELASAFKQLGLETTMLVREDSLFSRLGSSELSRFFTDLYADQGVRVVYGDSAAEFIGSVKVEGVLTVEGRRLSTDLVAAGIGVVPRVEWLANTGVKLDNGVVVDEYLQSANPDIFAAGDVANYFDPVFGVRRRVEHWNNAIIQGELAALNMLGRRTAFNTLAYFFSDLFDISWEWVGDNADTDQTVIRGSLLEKEAIVFFLKEKCIRAAFLLMQGEEEREWAAFMIKEARALSERAISRLADAQVALTDIV